MTIRQKLASYLLREQVAELNGAAEALWELWEKRPWLANGMTAPNALTESLQEAARVGEIDQHLVDNLIRRMNYVRLGTQGLDGPTEEERLAAVVESRLLYRKDVITQQIVELWTDFGFGQLIEVTPEEDDAAEAWSEFWIARRNRPVLKERRLYKLSVRLLNDGELFFVAFVNTGGKKGDVPAGGTTLRTIPTEQITEIVHDPEDADVALFYKREWTPSGETSPKILYYPDWEATEDDLGRATLPDDADRADEAAEGTGAVVLHAAYRDINGRGWPLMTAGAPWSRAYRDFCQDRAAVAAAVAMYVRKLKVSGGSRAVDAMRSQIESTLTQLGTYTETNPRATAGSTFVENQAADLTAMPLRTGASDAQADGAALIGQAGLGGRVFPHWLGRGESFRLATATAMEQPVLRAFRRYQMFWSDVWRDLVDLVLTMREEHGGESYKSHEARVSTDAQVSEDVTVTSEALVLMYEAKLVPWDIATRIALNLLGVADVAAEMEKLEAERKEIAAVTPAIPETPASERAVIEAAYRVVSGR